MTDDGLKGRLAAWPAAAAEALGPALDAAAETVAADIRRQPGAAVMVKRAADGRVTVAVSRPDAVALEFGTRRTAARPFLRPAVAVARDGIGRRLVETLRQAFPTRGTR